MEDVFYALPVIPRPRARPTTGSDRGSLRSRDLTLLPRKGKCNQAEAARESNPEFIRLRRRHSAVESAINALEAHGLDRCPDHGIDGFKRYVALAVLGRNLHRLGAILLERDAAAEERGRRRAA